MIQLQERRCKTALVLASTVVTMAQSPSAPVLDCPTAQSVRHGFVVERQEKSKTEVFVGEDGMVRTVLRYDGRTLLERTEFHGLFQLDRLDRGHRAVFRPKSELASLFPLKVGKTIKAEFDVEGSGRPVTAAVEFSVKKSDTLYIGPCKYDVLRLERRESRGDGALNFVSTDYYSPVLKLIIAKEYRDSGDRTSLIKFDRIYPIKN